MKVAVLLMSSDVEPSLRNVKAFKDTVVRYCDDNADKLNHEYRFFVYRYSDKNDVYVDDEYPLVTYIEYEGEESVYSTFEKTHSAFKDVEMMYHPDIYVRVNISTHINIPLFDRVIGELDTDFIYCNKINNFLNPTSQYFGYVYPRGDFMILSPKHVSVIIERGESLLGTKGYCAGVDHVDDCLIGVCLCDGDKDYYRKLRTLQYNFKPYDHIDDEDCCHPYAIATRLKTVPPNQVSGYSWSDNEYRMCDVDKFYHMDKIVKGYEYRDFDPNLVLSQTRYQIMRFDIGSVDEENFEMYIKTLKAGQ